MMDLFLNMDNVYTEVADFMVTGDRTREARSGGMEQGKWVC